MKMLVLPLVLTVLLHPVAHAAESLATGPINILDIPPAVSPEIEVDPSSVDSSLRIQTAPAISSNGSEFLVVWCDQRAVDQRPAAIFAARVALDGRVLDPVGFPVYVPILSRFRSFDETFGSVSVASDGKDFLVVWESEPRLFSDINGARVTAGGRVVDRQPIPISNGLGQAQRTPTVAWNGSAYLVAWSDTFADIRADVYAKRVTSAGVVEEYSPIKVCSVNGLQSKPRIASLRDACLVVWLDGRTGSYGVYGARVDTTGAVLDQGGFLISNRASSETTPSVAANGSDYLVVWPGNSTSIFGQRVHADGTPIDSTPISITTNGLGANVVNVGTNYLAVWEDRRNSSPVEDLNNQSSQRIFGTRITPSGAAIDSQSFLVGINWGGYQSAPSVASNGRDYLVVWSGPILSGSFGTSLQGEMISSEGIVSSKGVFDMPARGANPIVAWNGSEYLIVWLAQIPNVPFSSKMQGVRIDANGALITPVPFDVFTPVSTYSNPRLASDGQGYLIVWEQSHVEGEYRELVGLRLSLTGQPVDNQVIHIVRSNSYFSYGPTYFLQDVASNGDGYLVVWQDAFARADSSTSAIKIYEFQIKGAYLKQFGTNDPTTISPLTITSVRSPQRNPRVAACPDGYCVVWQDARNESSTGWDIYGRYVSSSGKATQDSEFLINGGPMDQTSPFVMPCGAGKFFVITVGVREQTPHLVGNFLAPQRISAKNGQIILSWPAIVGEKYKVQFTSDIVKPTWTDLKSDVVATGDTLLEVDSPGDSDRFYRILPR